jgi:pimeloyl-ACP methyl ester carboxylesterase
MQITPFSLPCSADAVTDLRARLERTRWPDTIEGSAWTYGFDRNYLQEMCRYWHENFDWQREISRLSSWNHFVWEMEGTTIHFIHERGRGPKPMPLLLLHGWPGSFLEMLKLAPLLTDPAAHGGNAEDSFDVVVPSLPGFGYSAPTKIAGMNTCRMSDLFAPLMGALGYERFAAHGGDFGAAVSSWLGRRHAERMIGIHLNYIPGSYLPGLLPGNELSSEELQFQRDEKEWGERWGAYSHLQRTTPLTLAYGLNDSPAALAAWILEKFRDWADCDGEIEKVLTRDELLANVTLYWMTETIHSSCRLYFEGRKAPLHLDPRELISVPCGIAHFPKEAPFPPRSWIERGYDVQHWTEMPRGGHFAAMEEPELLAQDIRDFFRHFR